MAGNQESRGSPRSKGSGRLRGSATAPVQEIGELPRKEGQLRGAPRNLHHAARTRGAHGCSRRVPSGAESRGSRPDAEARAWGAEGGARRPELLHPHPLAQPGDTHPHRSSRATVQSRSARYLSGTPEGAGTVGRGGRCPSRLRLRWPPIGTAGHREVSPRPRPTQRRHGACAVGGPRRG